MKIIEKILEVVKASEEHFVKFQIDTMGFTVYLDYDPERNFDEKCVIPIRYDCLYESVCIPDDEYREKFHPNEFGLEFMEIEMILKIMKLMRKHEDEIQYVCRMCDFEDRKAANKDVKNND